MSSQTRSDALARGGRGPRRGGPAPAPQTASQAASPSPVPAPQPETIATPQRLRRRPALVALAVIFIAVGALLAAYLVTTVGTTKPVVALLKDVPRGQVVQRTDLLVVDITPDPALRTVPGEMIDTVVGKYARVDLAAGGLLTSTAVTEARYPADGRSLVGLALSPAQLPAQRLQPGDVVVAEG